MGAVPIVIAECDEWHPPAWDWQKACLRLTESEFASMDLRGFRAWFEKNGLDRLEELRIGGAIAWARFRKENFPALFAETLASHPAAREALGWM